MHSHTGEKPFTCPMCDRAFSVQVRRLLSHLSSACSTDSPDAQSNLRRHLKIHKGNTTPNSTSGGSGTSAPRNLPRLATDRATMAAAAPASTDSPATGGSSAASRPSSGSDPRSASVGGTDGELDDRAIEEEDEDQAMADEAAAAKGGDAGGRDDEMRGEGPPLVRTAWPRARERN